MFDVFLSDPFTFMVSVFVFSLCIGSFLNVVAYRLPVMMRNQVEDDYLDLFEKNPKERAVFNLSTPHSACPKCKSPIKPWQNIPVISYLWLKGKCANCKTSISARYPIVELTTGLLGLLVAYQFGASWQTAALLIFTYFLVALYGRVFTAR